MKDIVLTLDYELFFGKESGTIENCMIKPMNLLLDLMEKYDCKMTIFWDVLHYIRAIELNKNNEVMMIEESIKRIVLLGHDIQLHIHSHWLDAQIFENKWVFPTYEHYNLQSFGKDEILEIVTKAKKTIENFTHSKVNTFRAGGWQIEPFEIIKDALELNEIFIDSSIAYDMVIQSNIVNLDFTGYPKDDIYQFSVNPKIKDTNGCFTELQIRRIKIPNYIILWSYINRLMKKDIYIPFGDGNGAGEVGKTQIQRIKTIIKRFIFGSIDMLALEFKSPILFKYTLKKAPHNSIMIGHPKSIGYGHIKALEDILAKKEIKFISLKELK